MKKYLVAATVFFAMLSSVFAQEVLPSLSEAESRVDVHRVYSVTTLVSDVNTNTDIRLIVTDMGLTTDVSPRFILYVIYSHAGEMNNTQTAFQVSNAVIIKKVQAIDNKHFKITVLDPDFTSRVISIDASQVYEDDKNLELDEFEGKYFQSSLKITESR